MNMVLLLWLVSAILLALTLLCLKKKRKILFVLLSIPTVFSLFLSVYSWQLKQETEQKAMAAEAQRLAEENKKKEMVADLLRCRGIGVDDPQKSYAACRKHAELGAVIAQKRLALRYLKGEGVAENKEQAFAWTLKAAEQGDEEAQGIIQVMSLAGIGLNHNNAIAVIAWYETLAAQNNIKAQESLVRLYGEDAASWRDETKSFYWQKKLAEKGNSNDQLALAVRYENGEGVAKDLTQAAIWYQKAAEQGNVRAQFELAYAYDTGESFVSKTWQNL